MIKYTAKEDNVKCSKISQINTRYGNVSFNCLNLNITQFYSKIEGLSPSKRGIAPCVIVEGDNA